MKITEMVWNSTMNSKTITFDYTGGEYTQKFNIRGTNLPWTYECVDNWIAITTASNSLTVKVYPIYDYETRTGTVKIFDKFRNELDLVVEQTGYYDLSVECPSTVVLYESYYNDNESYDVYVTVYGGPTQEVGCKKITPYLKKVWDNSDMYNDFILQIPKSLSGDFNIKHSDWKGFKDFCKANGIDYPKAEMEKKLSIVQVTKDDAIGEMVIEYNSEQFTNKSENVTMDITAKDQIQLKVISTKYTTVISRTEYRVIQTKDVKISICPTWVDVKIFGDKIVLKAKETNHFNDLSGLLRIENISNSNQFIDITLKQKSGT